MRKNRPWEMAVNSPCSSTSWKAKSAATARSAAATSTSGFRWRKPRPSELHGERRSGDPLSTSLSYPASPMLSQNVAREPRQGQAEGEVDDGERVVQRACGDECVAQRHVQEGGRIAQPAHVLLVGRRGRLPGLLAGLLALLLPALPARDHDEPRAIVQAPGGPVEVDVVPQPHGCLLYTSPSPRD